MGCSSCGKKIGQGIANGVKSVKNLGKAAATQPSVLKWFREGLNGIAKCVEGDTKYSDEDIVKNRDVCRECEFATKTDGKLTLSSQCMAIDPETEAPCACFILCKSSQGKCPHNKWTHLTVKQT